MRITTTYSKVGAFYIACIALLAPVEYPAAHKESARLIRKLFISPSEVPSRPEPEACDGGSAVRTHRRSQAGRRHARTARRSPIQKAGRWDKSRQARRWRERRGC